MQVLAELIKKAEKDLKRAPEGSLRIVKKKGNVQYYWKKGGEKAGGNYLKKSDIQIAKSLAQKSYAKKVLGKARRKRKLLELNEKGMDIKEILNIPESYHPFRLELIEPYLLSDEAYKKYWLAEWLAKKEDREHNRYPIQEGFLTESGEFVRSKSEKIIADKLFYHHIIYVYECPIYLKDGLMYVPDFIILNLRTRSTFYFEHFGMMGDIEYTDKTLRKLKNYAANDILVGENLLASFESAGEPLDLFMIEQMIQTYLI